MTMTKLCDYKDWISEKADEIACYLYDKDYYDLPEKLQLEVYAKAEEAYVDAYANMIDTVYERNRYAEGV
jgi:hypothetical protein